MAVKETLLYTPHCEPDEFPIGTELGVYGVGKLEALRAGLISSLRSAFGLGMHCDQQPPALGTPPSLP